MDALSSTLSTAASAVSDTVTQGAMHALVGGGDGAGGGEVASFIAKRGTHFVDGFARACVDATAANVRDAAEVLRTTTLNAAIQSEASATSDLPTLERAVKAMSSSAKTAIENYDRRSRAMPQLRYELLENLSEKKLALEKKIEAANAPRELARRQMLKEIMSKPRRG
ncbi:predicted protein [Ostreococcus lucimarinus CCE9901]|uniref:Uncharacterized protein n=2 Tax=Ostreococcus sp. 'lucimarinus' TaxID=242159 RepID=A4S2I5_OSTLU|nr:predicted protein [Ostreococcus lucimarinus CCE9901]ABO98050.1 predicted protein [Ostreococcus lucimarinus CCE9901]|eukprot:XP_001419757.1 predicted protein [Ostreococcus lucimarinus CCE9901]